MLTYQKVIYIHLEGYRQIVDPKILGNTIVFRFEVVDIVISTLHYVRMFAVSITKLCLHDTIKPTFFVKKRS